MRYEKGDRITGAQAKSPGEMLVAQHGMDDRLVLALSSSASSKAA